MSFSFNPLGHQYHHGLADIRRAFDATMTAIEAMCEEKRKDKDRTIEMIESGEIEQIEYDSDGYKVIDRLEFSNYLMEKAHDSANVARSGYVLILYHYWEKSCEYWLKLHEKSIPENHRYNPVEAYKWLKTMQIPLDKDGIERIRTLANFIKHATNNCREKYPEYFDPIELTAYRVSPVHSSEIYLKSEHLLDMFDILERSGYSIH